MLRLIQFKQKKSDFVTGCEFGEDFPTTSDVEKCTIPEKLINNRKLFQVLSEIADSTRIFPCFGKFNIIEKTHTIGQNASQSFPVN